MGRNITTKNVTENEIATVVQKQYIYYDSDGSVRIRSGRIDNVKMTEILDGITGKNGRTKETALGMPKGTIWRIRSGKRIEPLSDAVVDKIVKRSKATKDEVLTANGLIPFTGRPDESKIIEIFDVIQKASGMNQVEFEKACGLSSHFKWNYRSGKTSGSLKIESLAAMKSFAPSNCPFTFGEMLVANFCGNGRLATESAYKKARAALAKQEKRSPKTVVKETASKMVASKTAKTVEAKVSETTETTASKTVDATYGEKIVEMARALHAFGNYVGFSFEEIDALLKRAKEFAEDEDMYMFLKTFYGMCAANADSCEMTVTKKFLADFIKTKI